ncbi:hypothetical protein MKW94_015256 [Papaver nudicaule]|uniref:alpha-amylase n=1 Tax=Papaver nudicaule TaxID=74823 RepID=A0AA41VD71_PAPNU|nr:hypothetical protein [Papaver nudicaule]
MAMYGFDHVIHPRLLEIPRFCIPKTAKPSRLNYDSTKLGFKCRTQLGWNAGRSLCNYKRTHRICASSTDTTLIENSDTTEFSFKETFLLKRTEIVEGKVYMRFNQSKKEDDKNLQIIIGCNIPGKWILHWGVTYVDDSGSEWDLPPPEMRPFGSVSIKDYAIETPLEQLSSDVEGETLYELQINLQRNSSIAALNFVLKDEETGSWFQHRGRDFKVPLQDYIYEDAKTVSDAKKGFGMWPGYFDQLSSMLVKAEESQSIAQQNIDEVKGQKQHNKRMEGFCGEHTISKEVFFHNILTVSVWKCPEGDKNFVHLDTDLPGDVVVHWGVCRDDPKRWEIPAGPHPVNTVIFKEKALRTLLQPKENGRGSSGLFSLDAELMGLLFVLKLNDKSWLKYMDRDFYIPLCSGLQNQSNQDESEGHIKQDVSSSSRFDGSTGLTIEKPAEANEAVAYTAGIINEIRNLVSGITSEKGRKTKSKELHVNILQEIEKLAAEAYSIFRTATPTFWEEVTSDTEKSKPLIELCSGTGSGYEILCQGFNWESHKSGKWYMELNDKAAELSSLGFTIIWLPPPTESVSPEGYMPKDYYNLNSRYGNMEDLKVLVKRFHEVGIKVLGDVVLNHRCAHHQNQNGIWNIFGGRLKWDDSAVVADDPHFQGRGNKSSGDNFHAAPNIDHSQEFVRKDLKEWLNWLRKEIGYDGWRLDFVRGFWGGYVKDYLESSEPYFAVGEYWDSLSYTYGEMDHNQDAHRQRIIDWINATNGTSGAFDVTTKGILHSALDRCEYWRLSDENGKPPGVVGWWPSRAVTFIENHDTGSTQGHWRFPRDKEMQGYAYILTHPGTPSVFFDHIFSHNKSKISALISLRNRKKLHCRSTVEITMAEKDVYAAIIDENVAMKIGPGNYDPPSGPKNWVLAVEGSDYKVWETS